MNNHHTQLILGFTGGIGHAVALALSKRSVPIRVLVRDKSKAAIYAKGIDNLEIIQGDASNPRDLEKAFTDVDVAHYCINIPYQRWEKLAHQLLSKSIEAAIKHNTKLIFPGNVYIYGHAQYNPVDENHPHAAHTKKGKIRIGMEQLLEKSRTERNLKYSIVRMPDFYGPFVVNRFSEQLYINALKGKKLQWIGHLDTDIELIYIEDAGEAMAMVSLDENSDGQTYNIPGSAITTAEKYLGKIVAQAGSNSEISTMNSDWLFKIGGLFMPLAGEVFEMLYLKREKLILDGSKFKKHFGQLPTTPYSAGIEKTLTWAKSFYKLKKK